MSPQAHWASRRTATKVAATAMMALVTFTAACSNNEDSSTRTVPSADGQIATDIPGATGAAEISETPGGTPGDGAGSGTGNEAENSGTPPSIATSRISVSVIGAGPMGLTTVDSHGANAMAISGRLIVGPGSCFALKDTGVHGAPLLLVAPAGTEFTTRRGRPAATFPGQGTVFVGDFAQVSGAQVSLDRLDGVPERCTQGGTAMALVVS